MEAEKNQAANLDVENRQKLMEQQLSLKEDERKSRANSKANSDPLTDYLIVDMAVTGAEAVVHGGVMVAVAVNDAAKGKPAEDTSESVSSLPDALNSANKGNWSGIPDDHIASKAIEPTIPGDVENSSISSVTEAMGVAAVEHDTSLKNILSNNAANSGGVLDSIANLASDAVGGAVDMASSVATGAVDVASSVATGAVDVAGTVLSGAADVAGAVASGAASVVGSIFEGL